MSAIRSLGLAILSAAVGLADLNLALTEFRARDFRAAEAELRRLLQQDSRDPQARLYLAKTLIQLDRLSEALTELEVLQSQNGTVSVKFQVGEILRDLAERRFALLKTMAPNSAAFRELAGRQLEMKGQLDGALKEYETAAGIEPQRPGIHYWIGTIFWRQRRLEEAKRELETELAANPHHAMANLKLGQTLIAMNEEAAAVVPLQFAVQAMPNSAEAHKELGAAYFKVGKIPEARAEWEGVARQLPNDDQVHYLLGGLYRRIGEREKSQLEFAKHKEILEKRRMLAESK